MAPLVRNLTRVTRTALWDPRDDPTLRHYMDFRDLADGAVARSNSRGYRGGYVAQTTGANQPISTSGVVVGDGSNDRLNGTIYNTYSEQLTLRSRHLLPNGASNGTAGKGWTCTGSCRIPDGTRWTANHGIAQPSDVVWAPSLVHTENIPRTVISQIDLASIPALAGINTVQGVDYDATDASLWFTDAVHKKTWNITQAGVIVGSGFTAPGGFTPNGIACNEANDSYYQSYVESTNIDEISRVNGAVLKTYAFSQFGGADMLRYDASRNILWMSHGAAQSPNYVSGLNLTNCSLVQVFELPDADAIEAIDIDFVNNLLYLMNDGWFHQPTITSLNEMLVYSMPPPPDNGMTDIVEMMWVGKFVVAPVATKGIFTLGSPLLTTPIEQCMGMGLFATTATNFRCIGSTNNGATRQTVPADFAVPTVANDHIFWGRFDTTADLISLWCDGTLITPVSAAVLDNGRLGMGNSVNMVGVPSFIANSSSRRFASFFGGSTMRQKHEGEAAWAYGLQANLPGGHPYAAAPPGVP